MCTGHLFSATPDTPLPFLADNSGPRQYVPAMPSPGGMFNERFDPSARAARKAQDMARDVSLSRTLWDEPRADAVQAKLDAHLDGHRELLQDHPKWSDHYHAQDREKGLPEREQLEPPSCWDAELANDELPLYDHDRAVEEEQADFREMVADLKKDMTLERAQEVVNEGRGDQEHMRSCGEDASLCATCSGYERESMGDVELRNVSFKAAYELVEESKAADIEKSRFIRPPERDRGYDLGR